MIKLKAILPILAAATLIWSCAREKTSEGNQQTKEYIEAYLTDKYPAVKEPTRGIYILEDSQGSGQAWDGEGYVLLSVTTRDLSGNITATTDELTAKRVGFYSTKVYYGPKIALTSESGLAAGQEAMLYGMRKGGTRTALIPAWMMVYTRYKSYDDYIDHTPSSKSSATTNICTMTLVDFTDNVKKWQADSLQRYSQAHLSGVDSLGYGFYYKSFRTASNRKDFPSDTTVYVNYTGRLLNGLVFDTTIEDTAKVYNIYSASKTYEPVQINWASSADEITMGAEKSSIVEGFQQTLWNMRRNEKGAGVFIYSLGYGVRNMGSTIPAYSPLRFDVELVDAPE